MVNVNELESTRQFFGQYMGTLLTGVLYSSRYIVKLRAANYLYVIAGNACKDHHRKKREILTENLPEILDEKAGGMDEKIALSEAMDGLSDELREVAVIFDRRHDSRRSSGDSYPVRRIDACYLSCFIPDISKYADKLIKKDCSRISPSRAAVLSLMFRCR